jgi:hypothetical protein
MMDLQCFYDLCPDKVLSEKSYNYSVSLDKTSVPCSGFSYQDYLVAWSEHDSIHYLLELPFGPDGEKKAAFVEVCYQVGWGIYGSKYNQFIDNKTIFKVPKNFSRKKIKECADLLRTFYD